MIGLEESELWEEVVDFTKINKFVSRRFGGSEINKFVSRRFGGSEIKEGGIEMTELLSRV